MLWIFLSQCSARWEGKFVHFFLRRKANRANAKMNKTKRKNAPLKRGGGAPRTREHHHVKRAKPTPTTDNPPPPPNQGPPPHPTG